MTYEGMDSDRLGNVLFRGPIRVLYLMPVHTLFPIAFRCVSSGFALVLTLRLCLMGGDWQIRDGEVGIAKVGQMHCTLRLLLYGAWMIELGSSIKAAPRTYSK